MSDISAPPELEKPCRCCNDSELKLFVVGELSGDPEEWSPWGGYGLVLARSKEEALSFVDHIHAAEVEFDKAKVLCLMPGFPAL